MGTEIPVYLFVGFLEGGKTKFMQETLEDKRFHKGERTLVLVCEEGIEEFSPSKIPSKNITFATIDDVEELTEDNLAKLAKSSRATRILVEYNGMWQLNSLYEAIPEDWLIYQQMTFFDSATFGNYNANMRSLVVDKITDADMVVFNRMAIGQDNMPLHKAVRGINRRSEIAYEYTNGKVVYDDIIDPLPFDINADIIEVGDNDYALWYRDCTEDLNKYDKKVIKFKGLVAQNKQFDSKMFAIGRHIMTCCVEDITYGGVVCKCEKDYGLKTGEWVTVTAKISIEYSKIYKSKGPVLYVQSVEPAEEPEQPVVTF